MKKLLVLLAIAFVLLASCEPTTGGGGATIPPIAFGEIYDNGSEFLWLTEDINDPGQPWRLSYVNLDNYDLSEQDIIEIYVEYGDTTKTGYDPEYPYTLGFTFSSTAEFYDSRFNTFLMEKNEGGNYTDSFNYSDLADFHQGRYYSGVYWTINETFFNNIKNSNSITVTISNSNDSNIAPIVCTLPSKFSQTLRYYFN